MATTAIGFSAFRDDRGNVVEVTDAQGRPVSDTSAARRGGSGQVRAEFTGRNNRLVLRVPSRIADLVVHFNCDNGYVELGTSRGVPAFRSNMRVGQDARIVVGDNVSSTSRVAMSAVEGVSIEVGDDVMFATDNQLRSDDGHPIFDVRTGRRVNPARSITIGSHVWLGFGAVVLGGSTIADGTVVGMGAIVKGRFPNNCIVAGVPARVVRRDVAWERPHLSLAEPFYKPDASTVERSPYWRTTSELDTVPGVVEARAASRRLRSRTTGMSRRLPRALARRVGLTAGLTGGLGGGPGGAPEGEARDA